MVVKCASQCCAQAHVLSGPVFVKYSLTLNPPSVPQPSHLWLVPLLQLCGQAGLGVVHLQCHTHTEAH